MFLNRNRSLEVFDASNFMIVSSFQLRCSSGPLFNELFSAMLDRVLFRS